MFDFLDSATGVAELFPAVWNALERLVSPRAEDRSSGLNILLELDAHRISPLVAYVLATRLDDPDMNLRIKVVEAVGGLLSRGVFSSSLDEEGVKTPENVRQSLKFYLSQMRRRRIFALLQVADQHPSTHTSVAAIIKTCSHAGQVLADIFSDRRLPVNIRRQAIKYAGVVGFLDAAPRLEKLAERLEARMQGQRLMPFAPPVDSAEKALLPAIQTALSLLTTT
jgi:hypothetical protein